MLYQPASDRPWRVALYSHDSLGLGHIRRNLALAHALAEHMPAITGRDVTGLLFTGFDSVADQLPAGFDHVSLPGISKDTGRYAPRRLGLSMSRMVRIRSQLLAASLTAFEPDLVIVDRHALGFRGELAWALRSIKEERPHVAIVLGLREVLDSPDVASAEWARLGDPEEVSELLDAIWLYGDASVHDALATGEVPEEFRPLVTHTGYLGNGRPHHLEIEDPAPTVVTMVGGGADGAALCRAAVQATPPAGHEHLVVTGPQMSDDERSEIEAHARPGTRIVASVPDGYATIRAASAIVSMAGYNTVTEALTTSTPLLLVPRVAPRAEQLIRARGLERVGAADCLHPDDLTPEALTAWLGDAVQRRTDRTHLDLDGLTAVGQLASALLVGAPANQEAA